MKIKEALEIGNKNKLHTVGETIEYIQNHSYELFNDDYRWYEINELINDCRYHKLERNILLKDALYISKTLDSKNINWRYERI